MITILEETSSAADATAREHLARLWTLRLLRHAPWEKLRNYITETVARLLGRQDWVPPKSLQEFRDWIHDALSRVEHQAVCREGAFFENLGILSSTLGLSRIEGEILLFRVLLRIEGHVDDLQYLLDDFSDTRLFLTLADVLELTVDEVRRAFHPKSRLRSCGLVHFQSGMTRFTAKIGLQPGLCEGLLSPEETPRGPISRFADVASAPTLTRGCFPHLEEEISQVCAYLRTTPEKGRAGRNVLMFGPPGTGKTELAKIIAQEIGAALYEVPAGAEDGAPSNPLHRQHAYIFLQNLLAADDTALILFDEIEDIFRDSGGVPARDNTERPGKGWMNRTLDENPVPAIWISNTVRQIDAAHLRRFDICLELKIPPRPVRESILRKELNGLPVTDRWIRGVAENAEISPGVLARIATVAQRTTNRGTGDVAHGIGVLLKHRLATLGIKDVRRKRTVPDNYRIEYLNARPDISELPERLRKAGTGRILLYGPPGTGKTAFVHHLARVLDRTVQAKRASDILSMWVGGTERSLARIFEEAAENGEILLLDEADSLLLDRRQAIRSWEITQVNELLTQMEDFEGIFVCATNLIDTVDPAAMRRFSLKVRFEPLRAEQRQLLFSELVDSIGSLAPDEPDRERLRRRLDALDGLTPGDFEVVRQQFRHSAHCTPAADVLAALENELSLKPETRSRGIGFAR